MKELNKKLKKLENSSYSSWKEFDTQKQNIETQIAQHKIEIDKIYAAHAARQIGSVIRGQIGSVIRDKSPTSGFEEQRVTLRNFTSLQDQNHSVFENVRSYYKTG